MIDSLTYRGNREKHDYELFLTQNRMSDKSICKSDKTSPTLLDERHISR